MKFKFKYLMFPLVFIKSFFLAVTQVAWGLGGIVLLNLLLSYMLKEGIPPSLDKSFLSLESLIINNIMLFFWVCFAIYLYFDLVELKKGGEAAGQPQN